MPRWCPKCGRVGNVVVTRECKWGTRRDCVCAQGHKFVTEERAIAQGGTNDAGRVGSGTVHGYTRSERIALRELFIKWKNEHGIGIRGTPLRKDPNLRAAFYSVLVDHGYGYADLADWLGLSRERGRQLANRMGIDAPGVAMRIWDETQSRFVAAPYAKIAGARNRHRSKRRKQASMEESARRWDRAICAIRSFAAKHDRAPTVAELCRGFGFEIPSAFSGYLDSTRDRLPHSECMDLLFKVAGVERFDGRKLQSSNEYLAAEPPDA